MILTKKNNLADTGTYYLGINMLEIKDNKDEIIPQLPPTMKHLLDETIRENKHLLEELAKR